MSYTSVRLDQETARLLRDTQATMTLRLGRRVPLQEVIARLVSHWQATSNPREDT